MDKQDSIADFVFKSMEKVYSNIRALIDDAVLLYKKNQFPRASFCAMTAIEETGKLWILSLQHMKATTNGKYKPDSQKLTKILTDHTGKAFQMAAYSLFINAGADRRHGIHPISGIHRSTGIVLLARSREWMIWRNKCCYVDVDFNAVKFEGCRDAIDKSTAYYFICMAYEGLAEVTDAEVWLEVLNELNEFMNLYGKEVDLDKMDFLANSDKYEKLARSRKTRKG
jgi:AbiV family abortive infection protein